MLEYWQSHIMELPFGNLFKKIGASAPMGPSKVVGIDVGSASVKIVELEDTDSAIVLKSYGELQLGPYAGKALGEVADPPQDKVVEAVVDVIREAGIDAKDGVMAIPLNASFMTVIPLTLAEGDKLAAKIPVEARKYIPVPLPDVSLDWRELDTGAESSSNVHEVLIVAVETSALTRYTDLVRLTGLTAQPSEIEAFASLRALWHESDETIAVIDLGARMSKLYVAKDGLLERVHRVSGGGAQITRRLAEMRSVEFEEAENLKRSTDGEVAADALKATQSVLEAPLQEFKRIIDQYEMRQNAEVTRVVVTGGVSMGQGALNVVANGLGRDVEQANAFAKVAYPAFMEDTLKSISPTFHVALGAALKKFESTDG